MKPNPTKQDTEIKTSTIPESHLTLLKNILHAAASGDPESNKRTELNIEEKGVADLYLDEERGGLKARWIDAIQKQAPHVYGMAWKHRYSLWRDRVKCGKAVEIQISNIPANTTWRQVRSSLALGRTQFHLVAGAMGKWIVIVPKEEGQALIQSKNKILINGAEIELSKI